jgi:conjugative transfer signal peptidase TraF
MINKFCVKKFPLFLLLFIVGAAVFLLDQHLIFNITSSIPRGVYVNKTKKQVNKGDIVAICLPDSLRQEGLEKGYLGRSIYCQGTTPLIKEVVAIPNDRIIVRQNAMRVNNNVYAIPIYNQDSVGHALRRFPEGTYRAQGYWVLGTHNQRSWDSRYFGEINPACILCILRPVLIW